MSEARLTFLTIESPAPRRTIAVRVREGKSNKESPGLFWLGGFKSDMKGTKAEALDRWAAEQGRASIRFDYSGHGESGGDFRDGTIGRWLEESLAVYTQFAKGPQVLVGSSMGGWLALLLAARLREMKASAPQIAPLAGMVLIAIGSTTYMLLSRHLAELDPSSISRTLQGFLSGIGFLGGAVIFKSGFDVKGIKAAAAVWITGAIGLAIATSFWWLGTTVGVVTVGVMYVADSFPDPVREDKQEP